jgi:hypothetical protein
MCAVEEVAALEGPGPSLAPAQPGIISEPMTASAASSGNRRSRLLQSYIMPAGARALNIHYIHQYEIFME